MTYSRLYDSVLINGRHVASRYGDCYELLDINIEWAATKRPLRRAMSKELGYMELAQLLGGLFYQPAIEAVAPNANQALFTQQMAYGPRTREQMPGLIRVLREDPDTRQAVLFVADRKDGPTNNQPCTSLMQFLLRDNELRMAVYMRSWDVIKGLPYDVVMFGGLLQAVAWCVNAKPTLFVVHAGSAHIYLADLAKNRRPEETSRQYILEFEERTWESVMAAGKKALNPSTWTDGLPAFVHEYDEEQDSQLLFPWGMTEVPSGANT